MRHLTLVVPLALCFPGQFGCDDDPEPGTLDAAAVDAGDNTDGTPPGTDGARPMVDAPPEDIDAGPDCGALTLCGSMCVDTTSDPDHCGSCDATCAPVAVGATAECRYGLCIEREVLYTSDRLDDEGLAQDADNLYLVEHNGPPTFDRSIVKLDKTTHTITPLVEPNRTPRSLIVEGNDIFYSTPRTIGRVGTDGSGHQEVVTHPSSSYWQLTMDADSFYRFFTDPAAIVKIDRTTGIEQTLASISGPRALTIDATSVFFTTNGTVGRVDKTGGPVTSLADNEDSPYSVTLDGTHVYWANYISDGSVRRTLKAGGAIEELAPGGGNTVQLAVDAGWLVWCGYTAGLRRIAPAGGPVQTLAGGYMRGFVADAETYYVLVGVNPISVTRIAVIPATP